MNSETRSSKPEYTLAVEGREYAALLERPTETQEPLTYSAACDLLARYAIALQDRQVCGDEYQPQYIAALRACTEAMGVKPQTKDGAP